MNASQVPEWDGGPVADSGSTGDPEQPAYVTGEPALWGEALPWAEGVGVHDLSGDGRTGRVGESEYETGSTDHGEASSGFSGEAGFSGVPAPHEHLESQTAPMGTFPVVPVAATPMVAHGEQSSVVQLSASVVSAADPDVGSAGKQRKRRRNRRLAIAAAVACTGLVVVSVGVVTQHKGGGKPYAAPAGDATGAGSVKGTSAAHSVRPGATPSGSPSPSADIPAATESGSVISASPSMSGTASSGASRKPSVPHAPSETHPMTIEPTTEPSTKPTASSTVSPASRSIYATAVLDPGQSVTWGKGTLAMTSGGNLIVTDERGVTRWATHTSGSNLQTVFQDDGCLAIYDPEGNVMWSSYTNGNPGAVLVMTASGNIQIQLGGTSLWQTGTGH